MFSRGPGLTLPTVEQIQDGSWYDNKLRSLGVEIIPPRPLSWYQRNRLYRWAVLRWYGWRIRRGLRRFKKHELKFKELKRKYG